MNDLLLPLIADDKDDAHTDPKIEIQTDMNVFVIAVGLCAVVDFPVVILKDDALGKADEFAV